MLAAGIAVAVPAPAAVTPGPAVTTAQPVTSGPPVTAGPPAPPAGSAAPSSAAPAAPCPGPKPPPPRPPRPSPPPPRPADRAVGGAPLATSGLAAPPGVPSPPATVTATSWVVADLDSGAVLGACAAHQYAPPASVQKLLLLATVLPKLDPNQIVEVTHEDMNFEPGSSAVGLVEGGHYSVETLLLGLLLNSGNDAANVLARLGDDAAGRPGTIEAMNAEAHRLGADQTHAVTPSGLDGPGQFTSSYDLALIARADFAREDFRRYAATRQPRSPPNRPAPRPASRSRTTTSCCTSYPGALGGKTGFTDAGPAHLRRRRRAQRPAAGGHAARRRGPAAARLATGRRAARLGLRAAARGRRSAAGDPGPTGPPSAATATGSAPSGSAVAPRAAGTSPAAGVEPGALRRAPVGSATLTRTSIIVAGLLCLVAAALLVHGLRRRRT